MLVTYRPVVTCEKWYSASEVTVYMVIEEVGYKETGFCSSSIVTVYV